MPRLLGLWSRSLPVVLVHWLPERLWQATAIGWSRREAVTSSPEVAGHAARPDAGRRGGRTSRGGEGRAIPITTLSPRSLRRWVHMLAKRDGTPVPAVILPAHAQVEQAGPEGEKPRPEDLVHWFDASASGDARRLLRMLAGVPLSLPVIRLVRSSLMPDSDPSVVAEVLLSGLIEQLDPGDPEAARFGLRDGVSAVLLENASAHDLHATLRTVADHLGVQFGGKSFDAALDASDLSTTRNAFNQDAGTFALAAAPVLHRLGGRYRQLAEKLEALRSSPPPPDETSSQDATAYRPDGSETALAELDLERIAELPPGLEIEIQGRPVTSKRGRLSQFAGDLSTERLGFVCASPPTSGIQVLTSEEFVKGIQEVPGQQNDTVPGHILLAPRTQLGETLLYVVARRKGMKGPTKPTSGGGRICRATIFESLENEAVRIARLLPKKTNKLSECVIFVTRDQV